MRNRVVAAALAIVAGGAFAAACGDDGGGDAAAGGDTCPQAPLVMRLEATGDVELGSPEFDVSDAVVRRVPILPGAETTGDPEVLADRQEQAAATELALYSLSVADFEIDRSLLEGFGFGDVTPDPGGTVGTLTIVPTDADGFAAGDTATGDDELDYEVTTTFAPLGLTIASDAGRAPASYTDVVGQVEIVQLEDASMCLDIDVEFVDSDEIVAAARGIVSAPIVRAADEFYFT